VLPLASIEGDAVVIHLHVAHTRGAAWRDAVTKTPAVAGGRCSVPTPDGNVLFQIEAAAVELLDNANRTRRWRRRCGAAATAGRSRCGKLAEPRREVSVGGFGRGRTTQQ
jgi:hypothetical protein